MKKTNICSYKTLKIVKEGVVGNKNKNEKLMVTWVKIEFFRLTRILGNNQMFY